ncbi:MAG: helix-turn-helix domain-containing protein, partial [Pseudomonadota bacterium]
MPIPKPEYTADEGMPAICANCEARNGGICSALTSDELVFLSRQSVRAQVSANSEITAADEAVARYSNIIKGVVKLTKLMPDGRQQIVGLQFAPDLIGRPFQTHSQVTAEAANDVQLCSFSKRALDELLSKSPNLEHKLHMQTLSDLDKARDTMLLLGRKSAAEKVASFLLLLIRNLDNTGSKPTDQKMIELPLRRLDIADFLGLTIETVSRQLTKLRKAGIIGITDNRMITVVDPARLEKTT